MAFLRPLIEHYNETFPETSVLVRGDSCFAVLEPYELGEKESLYYIIRLKSNAKLKALAEELHPVHEIRDVSVTESYVEESIRPAGELFFSHAFLSQI